MTVGTMLVGLIPLLWATGSGADVMKRIAAPMVGGLVTSAFLTLEIIPVVATYWRQEQLLWERLTDLEPKALLRLQRFTLLLGCGWLLLLATLVLPLYLSISSKLLVAATLVGAGLVVIGTFAYLFRRRSAKHIVWPEPPRIVTA
jgi:Cu(I)/Ag(I) efflux system membrane protein CusA/SilA